jgi:hypothetical protein
MTIERDLERAVRAWVAQGSEQLPDVDLDAALQEISITPQRRTGWLARRFRMMDSNMLRFGVAAVSIIAAGAVGVSYLLGNVGSPTSRPTPSPAATLASGSFTAPLTEAGTTTVDIEATGGGANVSGVMNVSDADGRFSVDLQCSHWTEFHILLIGGAVTDSTHDAAAVGERVVIAFHPRSVITTLLWVEGSPPAENCGAFLGSVSIPIEVANDMETVSGTMRFESYAAHCDGRGCSTTGR